MGLELFTQKHFLEHLVKLYSQEETNIHEHVLSAISVLIDNNPEAISQAKLMSNLNLKKTLSDRLEVIRDDPRYLVSGQKFLTI